MRRRVRAGGTAAWVVLVVAMVGGATPATAAPANPALAQAAVRKALGSGARVAWDPRRGLTRASGLDLRLRGSDRDAAESILRRLAIALHPGVPLNLGEIRVRDSKYTHRVDGDVYLDRAIVADVVLTVESASAGAPVRAVSLGLGTVDRVDRQGPAVGEAALREGACAAAKRLSPGAVCKDAPVTPAWYLAPDRVLRRGALVRIPTASLEHAWEVLVDGRGQALRTLDRARR